MAVQAATSENVTNVAAAGAAGFYAGLAGGVSVEMFNSNTQAYIGKMPASIRQRCKRRCAIGGSLGVRRRPSTLRRSTRPPISRSRGGWPWALPALPAASTSVCLNNSTAAYIGNGAERARQQDVDVYALSNDAVQTYAIGPPRRPSLALDRRRYRSGRSARRIMPTIPTPTATQATEYRLRGFQRMGFPDQARIRKAGPAVRRL